MRSTHYADSKQCRVIDQLQSDTIIDSYLSTFAEGASGQNVEETNVPNSVHLEGDDEHEYEQRFVHSFLIQDFVLDEYNPTSFLTLLAPLLARENFAHEFEHEHTHNGQSEVNMPVNQEAVEFSEPVSLVRPYEDKV